MSIRQKIKEGFRAVVETAKNGGKFVIQPSGGAAVAVAGAAAGGAVVLGWPAVVGAAAVGLLLTAKEKIFGNKGERDKAGRERAEAERIEAENKVPYTELQVINSVIDVQKKLVSLAMLDRAASTVEKVSCTFGGVAIIITAVIMNNNETQNPTVNVLACMIGMALCFKTDALSVTGKHTWEMLASTANENMHRAGRLLVEGHEQGYRLGGGATIEEIPDEPGQQVVVSR